MASKSDFELRADLKQVLDARQKRRDFGEIRLLDDPLDETETARVVVFVSSLRNLRQTIHH